MIKQSLELRLNGLRRNAVILLEMAPVFVKGFNGDYNSRNFLPGIEYRGPHRLLQQAAFPNSLRKNA
jgi:hypothetical protein